MEIKNKKKLKEKIEFKIIVEIIEFNEIVLEIIKNVNNENLEIKKHIKEIFPKYIESTCIQNRIEDNNLRINEITKMQGYLDTIKILIEILNNNLEISKKNYLKIDKKIEILEKMQNSLKKYVKGLKNEE